MDFCRNCYRDFKSCMCKSSFVSPIIAEDSKDADLTDAVNQVIDDVQDDIVFPKDWSKDEIIIFALHKLREIKDELNALPEMSMELTLLTLTGVKS